MSKHKLVPVEPIMRAIYALECFANDTLAGRNSAHELRELLDVAPAVQGEPEIEPYDAGSLNDFGGGDVGWWHDYIRAELDRAYEFYLIQLAAAPQPAPTTPTGGESDE